MEPIERYRGALLGLAAGDALGTTLEFEPRDSYAPVTGMIGGGPFRLRPGEWTDDTSMALCLAESLIERAEFDPVDQMERYIRWRRHGYNSSTGHCFDVGITTADALARFWNDRNPHAGSTDPQSAGNGSIMRLAPVALRYARDPHEAIRRAAESSRTTHGATEAVDGCRYLAALLVGALAGARKADLLAAHYSPVPGVWAEEPLAPAIAAVAAGSFSVKRRDEISSSGYVVHTLEAALWAFARTESFRDGALLAVNLGHDADTVGAVYGQLAGAFYGESGIPAEWRSLLARHDDIRLMADRLFERAWSRS